MLLKEIKNFMETNKNYGIIQVLQDDLLIVEDICKNKKEFKNFMEWLQNTIIFNKDEKYNHLSGKEIDIVTENERIASYIVR